MQAEARKAAAGALVWNVQRGRTQVPLQNASALRDIPPSTEAGPAAASWTSLLMTRIVTVAAAPEMFTIEHSIRLPPDSVTGGEAILAVTAAAGRVGPAAARAAAATSRARAGVRSRGMGVLQVGGSRRNRRVRPTGTIV